MSRKSDLRVQRTGTVINSTSTKQEKDISIAIKNVIGFLSTKYPTIKLEHTTQWYLKDIVNRLKNYFPEVDFFYNFETSSLKPDGGILYIFDNEQNKYPILISEVKNQGTNDIREIEGLPKQSKGNAIERLGKNVIGLRTALQMESIFPFVCFGYGCDFESTSSILDRVVTINMFGKLCITNLHNIGPNGIFNRGSYYFRPEKWTIDEMEHIMSDIADRSIMYYFSKYGYDNFDQKQNK